MKRQHTPPAQPLAELLAFARVAFACRKAQKEYFRAVKQRLADVAGFLAVARREEVRLDAALAQLGKRREMPRDLAQLFDVGTDMRDTQRLYFSRRQAQPQADHSALLIECKRVESRFDGAITAALAHEQQTLPGMGEEGGDSS